MTAALVVVPTHDHAELLALSLASLREQTVADLEIAVICDGVGDETRDVVGDARRHDPRIVLHDLPKAGRTGEPHRHPIISQSDAEVVVYLCDDDLLLPDHVEQMLEVLQSNDLAVSLPLCVDGEGSLVIEPVDLGQAG